MLTGGGICAGGSNASMRRHASLASTISASRQGRGRLLSSSHAAGALLEARRSLILNTAAASSCAAREVFDFSVDLAVARSRCCGGAAFLLRSRTFNLVLCVALNTNPTNGFSQTILMKLSSNGSTRQKKRFILDGEKMLNLNFGQRLPARKPSTVTSGMMHNGGLRGTPVSAKAAVLRAAPLLKHLEKWRTHVPDRQCS
jgi:hypothetical protein